MATASAEPSIFEPKKTLVLTNLCFFVKEKTLWELFSLFGEIKYLKILHPLKRWRTYHGLIVYAENCSASAAEYAIQDLTVDSKKLKLMYLWSSPYLDQRRRLKDPNYVTSDEETEKRVVHVKSFLPEVGNSILEELEKFGTTQKRDLNTETTPCHLYVTYESPFSAAVAAVLAAFSLDSGEEIEVYLSLGRCCGHSLFERWRIEPPSEEKPDPLIAEKEIQCVANKVKSVMSMVEVINKDLIYAHQLFLAKKTAATPTEIFSQCRWKEKGTAIQVLVLATHTVTFYLEINYEVPSSRECTECHKLNKDLNLDPAGAMETAVTPNVQRKSFALVQLQVKVDERITRQLGGSNRVENPLYASPLGCAVVSLYVEAGKPLEGTYGPPELKACIENANYLCPKIVRYNGQPPSREQVIPNSRILNHNIRGSENWMKDKIADWQDSCRNEELPYILPVAELKINFGSSAGEIYKFPVLYYFSSHKKKG